MFSVTVFYDERIVVVAEQRPDASEEDSFQWMSRVLQVRLLFYLNRWAVATIDLDLDLLQAHRDLFVTYDSSLELSLVISYTIGGYGHKLEVKASLQKKHCKSWSYDHGMLKTAINVN